jgi:hypothetical protein
MRMTPAATLSLVMASVTIAVAVPARAHISLDAPKARYWQTSTMQGDQNKLKVSPCGPSGTDTRTKDASLITTYRPGEKVMVRFRETIQHPGHFEISFDSDGQDFPFPGEAPAANSGVTVLAPNIPDKSSNDYSYEVTLPDMECEKCTLQLVQVMTSKAPPYSKMGDLYFQCADLILKAGGGGGAGGQGSGAGGATSAGMAGASSVSGGSTMSGTATGGTSTGGMATGGTLGGGAASGGASSSTGGAASGGAQTGGSSSSTGGTPISATTGGSSSPMGGASGTTSPPAAGMTSTPLGAEPEASCTLSRSPRSGAMLSLFALAGLLGWRRRARP